LAALEAMACGVPVLSSNSGGLPEVNIDGFSGYLSEVGEVGHMANRGLEILSNDSVLQTFKTNARLTAEKFGIQQVLPLYEAIYTRAIARKKDEN
jgi:glycosyltransferase involved in cell wall biosynthesis